ncbi:MAG: VOC family protein [Bacteroidetes bacterium]|nr:VOC family protein [Bacteroidota bacterium]
MVNSVRMGHIAIEVSDIRKAADFYSSIFPFDIVYVYDDWGLLRHRETGDDLALLIPGGNHHPHNGIRVRSNAEVDAAYSELAESGIRVKTKPKLHRDGSYSFYFSDPDSNLFEIIFDPSNP